MSREGAGIYVNDRQVRRLIIERFTDRNRPRIEVEVVADADVLPFPKKLDAQLKEA